MKTIMLFGSAAAVAMSGGFAFAGNARPSAASPPQAHHLKPSKPPCCKRVQNQRDNDNGIGIVSQDFTDPMGGSFDIYDSQGADDFIVATTTKVVGVAADGVYFNGSGPASSFNVTYYKNKKGKPGAVVKSCVGVAYTDGGLGSPTIKCPAHLKAGTYWLSIQANMNFSTGGEWGWNTNNTVRGAASKWQNPGNGFSTGCVTYTDTLICIPSGEGGDFSFSVG